jgi:hypothetical protein
MSGDRLAVGAYGDDENTGITNDDRGAVYTFKWNGSAWVQDTNLLQPTQLLTGDNFGYSGLSMSDDKLVVAAVLDDDGPNSNSGAVYSFTVPLNQFVVGLFNGSDSLCNLVLKADSRELSISGASSQSASYTDTGATETALVAAKNGLAVFLDVERTGTGVKYSLLANDGTVLETLSMTQSSFSNNFDLGSVTTIRTTLGDLDRDIDTLMYKKQ